MVKFTRPEESEAEHEKLTHDAEEILETLGLPYRRMLLCTSDTGFSSPRPTIWKSGCRASNSTGRFLPAPNFDAFQARRANIRYRPTGPNSKGKPEFVHTINGSGLPWDAPGWPSLKTTSRPTEPC